MASASLRESFNSLGWSRRDNEPVATAPQPTGFMASIRNMNPFGDSGYMSLPTAEPGAPLPAPTRREEEEGWFALSRWDRLMIFAGCNLGALACFVICFTLFPVLATMGPRKFVILWSMGSALFLGSFAAVMGPMNYLYHLFSGPRIPFTVAYFGSIIMTMVFAIKLHSTILTLLAAIVQIVCLVWYLVSYFPMGSTGLRFATSYGARQATAWMSG
ncbi:hypothetical protein V2G26_000654 [Clonostachys chloroleuca]|uniref:Protein transport protein SFT2 n=5 Tax=Clonostachys TaxID=110564 RepID=A0A0B7KKE8_BIOOC|nr:unnamed protein product [Clonostachys rosea f. rosea IK726]CAH0001011.1 unnamed protein product [Clonostachys byssicola]CAH0019389.1 unnamed protein product [Clonostachys rhizophaga]CAI6099962.1 unnamed protein product [Clonostachys chloroleuca]